MAPDDLWRRLAAELAARGPAGARELAPALRVSQATFSRLVSRNRAALLITGRARSTRYALRRTVADVGPVVPVYEVTEDGGSQELATLHAIAPEGFFVESRSDDVDERFHSDLPYFLNDLRPAGFLGRLIPRQHPELGLPRDVSLWSADHTLRYWTRFGWNLPGSLIVGKPAFQAYLEHVRTPRTVSAKQRSRRYPVLADDVLAAGPAGSSAAGEQPKFLVTVSPGQREMLVKFSPRKRGAVSRRFADLLVAEHMAHGVLRRHGQTAAESTLIEAGSRLFLEVKRFDRTEAGGRRGVISLLSLDAEHLGRMRSWTESTRLLAEAGHLDASLVERVQWIERFGQLIANTDRHLGNVSFFARGARVLELAPVYDMVPMLYAPVQGHLPEREFVPPIPTADDAPIWTP